MIRAESTDIRIRRTQGRQFDQVSGSIDCMLFENMYYHRFEGGPAGGTEKEVAL